MKKKNNKICYYGGLTEKIESIETKISDLLGPGYQSGGLVMNYGDYGRSYT